mmetsp:Transcript_12624/g.47185  ORF Transcript_12624/g.47185 Transcript_12624/m.47185 type:complete len:361 (+) Transcript_12624:377-1459(+)
MTSPNDDDPTRRELWRGCVPLEIHLARDEVASVVEPAPYFALVPRSAYLPTWCEEQSDDGKSTSPRAHFAGSTADYPELDDDDGKTQPSKKNQPWFDHQGIPLRWQLPIGVLFDLVGNNNKHNRGVPFKVTAHYRGPVPTECSGEPFHGNDTASGGPETDTPADTPAGIPSTNTSTQFSDSGLFVCPDTKTCRSHFFNSLKEACFIRTGSATRVMQMTNQAQGELWKSALSGDFQLARVAEGQLGRGEAVDSDVGGNVTTQSGSNLADGTTTSSSNTQPVSVRLPIRVYVRDSHAFSNWRDVRYVSAPMRSIFSGDETFEGAKRRSIVRDALRLAVGREIDETQKKMGMHGPGHRRRTGH